MTKRIKQRLSGMTGVTGGFLAAAVIPTLAFAAPTLRYPTAAEVEGAQKTLQAALLELDQGNTEGYQRKIDYAVSQLKPKRPKVRMTEAAAELQCRIQEGPLRGAYSEEGCFTSSWNQYAFDACYVGEAKVVAERINDGEYRQGTFLIRGAKRVRRPLPTALSPKREVLIEASLFDESIESTLNVLIPPC